MLKGKAGYDCTRSTGFDRIAVGGGNDRLSDRRPFDRIARNYEQVATRR